VAAKPEVAKADAGAETPAEAPAPTSDRRRLAAWLPVLLAVVLAPAATWATVEFFLLPRLRHQLAAPLPAETAGGDAAAAGDAKGKPDGKGKTGDAVASYEFQNVLVNLAGTMGTRYLKTSFMVTGAEPNIKTVFEAAKPRLTDVTLNVLSSLTLADLEEPGAKNVIREKLVNAYNQALGRKVAQQVYFSDFVIQ